MSKNKINKFSLLGRVVTDNDHSNNCNNGSLEGMATATLMVCFRPKSFDKNYYSIRSIMSESNCYFARVKKNV
jgi:hypothetical protein